MPLSFFDKKIHPIRQAAAVFVFALIFMAGGWLLQNFEIFETDKLFSWAIATGFLLLFGILNSVFSLTAENRLKYWRDSIYSYFGLAVANGLAAWAISGLKVNEAGSYKFIYVVVTVGFIVFISMVNAMRTIVEFAQKEEWNEPRNRK